MSLLKKNYLLTPGPTPIPERVLMAASQPLMHHRTEEFSAILQEAQEGIKHIFQTKNDIFILTSSGSGAMEAAVVNSLSPGDRAITINGGKFGDRWGKICRAYGVDIQEIKLDWGDDLSKGGLSEALKAHPETKAVFTTLTETSTGTLFDIQGFGELISKTQSILVVDGISGVGTTPCPMDDWNIDILISGSQKSFMTPPGLAYIAFSPKAWHFVEKSTLPKFYFDAKAAKKSHERNTTPWTPAISLVMQQTEALRIILNIGLANLIAHHRILGQATRAGVEALGLELLSRHPANILTAIKVPSGIDGIRLLKTMQDKYKAHVAGAQEPHKGEFFRIAHLGYMGGFDVITALSALEMSLSDLKYPYPQGESVKAAQIILKENWE
jgi:aspartate aminotransferase-like enzyme